MNKLVILIKPDVIQRDLTNEVISYIKDNLLFNGLISTKEYKREPHVIKRGRLSNKEVYALCDLKQIDLNDHEVTRRYYQRNESIVLALKTQLPQNNLTPYLKIIEDELQTTYGVDHIRNSVDFVDSNIFS